MTELSLPVVVAALVHKDKILLIKRIKGSYIGYWALPGGKIERSEHVSQAAVREIQEETGVNTKFKQHLGSVSELLIENGVVLQHFLLHLCELEVEDPTLIPGNEGELAWFDLAELEKEKIVSSDYLMIKKMLQQREKNYYNCVIEKRGEEYFLRKFE